MEIGDKPAFPPTSPSLAERFTGLSIRQYAALEAMKGLMAAGQFNVMRLDESVDKAYRVADAMINEEAKRLERKVK